MNVIDFKQRNGTHTALIDSNTEAVCGMLREWGEWANKQKLP